MWIQAQMYGCRWCSTSASLRGSPQPRARGAGRSLPGPPPAINIAPPPRPPPYRPPGAARCRAGPHPARLPARPARPPLAGPARRAQPADIPPLAGHLVAGIALRMALAGRL